MEIEPRADSIYIKARAYKKVDRELSADFNTILQKTTLIRSKSIIWQCLATETIYRDRWEIKLLFRYLKTHNELSKIHTLQPPILQAMLLSLCEG